MQTWAWPGLLLPLVVAAGSALFFLAFAGSAAYLAPRDLPVGVVGDERGVATVQHRLAQTPDGDGFQVVAFANVDDAEAAIHDREIYGAIVPSTEGPSEVLVASAASPAVAQILSSAASALGDSEVIDLAPAPRDDPRGTGLAGGALPITICGIIAGTSAALLFRSRRRQLTMVAVTSTCVGTVGIGILHGWLGSLEGDVLAEFATLSLGVAAIATLAVGAHACGGRVGLVLLDLVLVLVGNPLSGANAAPELLPFGEVGHWMPLGATIDALRGISGFDGAAIGTPLQVLVGWAALGLTLTFLGVLRPDLPDANRVSSAP